MKKLVLSAVLLTAVVISVTAQTKKVMPVEKTVAMSLPMSSPTAKGKWLVGPALAFESYTDEDGVTVYKKTTIDFQPEIAYFIANDLSVGLSFGISTEQIKVDGIAEAKGSGFAVAPTLRYYLNLAPKFKFLGKFQIPIGSLKQTLSNGNPVDLKTSYWGLKLTPAFAFFPSDKISLELSWGSANFIAAKTGNEKSNSFGFDLFNDHEFSGAISSPMLGVKWHLGK